jgi:hypothetical protein
MLDHSAVMLAVDPMLDERGAVATNAASTQLGVELLKHARGDLRNRYLAKRRLDRSLHISAITVER